MKTILGFFFSVYFAMLFYIFFLARRRPSPTFLRRLEPINFSLFKGKIHYFRQPGPALWHDRWQFYSELIGNVLLFIPFPFFFLFFTRVRQSWKLLVAALLTSLCIETVQFVFSIGLADIDDVILNTAGAAIGLWLYRRYKPRLSGTFLPGSAA